MSQRPDQDVLFVTGLKVDAIIGVFDWEREVRQELVFDLELTLDLSAAAHSDDVVTRITQDLGAQLVEHLADAVASTLLEKWPIEIVKLRLTKPTAVPAATGVGVAIVRSRQAP